MVIDTETNGLGTSLGGAASFLHPDSLDVLGTTAVGGEPHALLEAKVMGMIMVLAAVSSGLPAPVPTPGPSSVTSMAQ